MEFPHIKTISKHVSKKKLNKYNSWRVLDISIAIAYAMISTYAKTNHRSISAGCAILRGFHQIYPLTSVEQSYLLLLVKIRLCCSATLGALSIHEDPTNEYLKLHSEPAWKVLELLCCSDDVDNNDGKDLDFKGKNNGSDSITAAIDRMFQIACCNITRTDVNDTIKHNETNINTHYDHSDISFPDPYVIDPLASIREQLNTNASVHNSSTSGIGKVRKYVSNDDNEIR